MAEVPGGPPRRRGAIPPSRRRFLGGASALTGLAWLDPLLPAYAWGGSGGEPAAGGPIDLSIGETRPLIDGKPGRAMTVNGTLPGPLIRLREGDEAVLRVSNTLKVDSSIHWHGILLPANMDGVPGLSFAGIAPGETYEYRFPVEQSGTYWYHSHSGLQEQSGVYGPLVIDPADPDPFEYEREHVVMLSDWTFMKPEHVMRTLKSSAGAYNYQRRTVSDVVRGADGMSAADASAWGRMRMDPTDISDVTGAAYTYLMNGRSPVDGWAGGFEPGERVRLRLINGSAMTYFDVRIPGLEMTVVAADGQNVKPVTVDELRIAVAETYDVIVHPREAGAYTIFAETMDRSGFARGTLASSEGLTAPVPERRRRGVRTMADMGMAGHGADMGSMAGHDMGETTQPAQHDMGGMAGHDMGETTQPAQHDMGSMAGHDMGETTQPAQHDMGSMAMDAGTHRHGPGTTAGTNNPVSRLHEPGVGLEDAPWRVLTYADLSAPAPFSDPRPPSRDLELHLTGNMERYMWSFDGKKFSEVKGPIVFEHGERLRLVLVNDTMMEHPIHLHGMWMELEGTRGEHRPRKHTVNVKPAERLSALITADALGEWAFHCHLLFHMEMGMFRVVSVRETQARVER